LIKISKILSIFNIDNEDLNHDRQGIYSKNQKEHIIKWLIPLLGSCLQYNSMQERNL
jgi:hypothetical protein